VAGIFDLPLQAIVVACFCPAGYEFLLKFLLTYNLFRIRDGDSDLNRIVLRILQKSDNELCVRQVMGHQLMDFDNFFIVFGFCINQLV
jgi:hypothetical protein